jgi:hypothetical protein
MWQTQHLQHMLQTAPQQYPPNSTCSASSPCYIYKLAHLYCGKGGGIQHTVSSTPPEAHLTYTTQRHQATARCTLPAEDGWAADAV